MHDEGGRSDSAIGDLAADMARLRAFSEKLSRKMRGIDARSLADPEFVRRSLVSIYESHAILAAGMVSVLETLRTNGFEIAPPEDTPEPDARPRPHLRLVDPESP